MPQPRQSLVSVNDTPYYHVISRCVRRTFLCGIDHQSGKSYEHRRQWIEDRIRLLSSLFTIDICAYAVMSNHFHLVVKLLPEQADSWSTQEVLDRWCALFKGPLLVQKFHSGDALDAAQLNAVSTMAEVYRKRLTSLSWFMKCLNEPIARQANKEDDCTGHFWEARFKSQALLTEEALLSCMTYVDLNPVRAGIAETPEDSHYTSVKERIKPEFDAEAAIKEQQDQQTLFHLPVPVKPLLKFEGGIKKTKQSGILYEWRDYLELVDYTGRAILPQKRGSIPFTLPNIIQRLGMSHDDWMNQACSFEKQYNQRYSRRSMRKRKAAS